MANDQCHHQQTLAPLSSMTTYSQPIPFREKSQADLLGPSAVGEKYRVHNSQKVQNAYNYLGEMIGYKNHRVDITKLRIILADTLSTLEKLKFGSAVTHRPRELDEAIILRKMAHLVPRDCVDMARISKIRETEGKLAARATKIVILADYIRDAQKTQVQQCLQTGVVPVSVPLTKQPVGQLSVEQTLQQIEKWCDAWLQGDLEDRDWNTFEECLNQKQVQGMSRI